MYTVESMTLDIYTHCVTPQVYRWQLKDKLFIVNAFTKVHRLHVWHTKQCVANATQRILVTWFVSQWSVCHEIMRQEDTNWFVSFENKICICMNKYVKDHLHHKCAPASPFYFTQCNRKCDTSHRCKCLRAQIALFSLQLTFNSTIWGLSVCVCVSRTSFINFSWHHQWTSRFYQYYSFSFLRRAYTSIRVFYSPPLSLFNISLQMLPWNMFSHNCFLLLLVHHENVRDTSLCECHFLFLYIFHRHS